MRHFLFASALLIAAPAFAEQTMVESSSQPILSQNRAIVIAGDATDAGTKKSELMQMNF